ncbi:MAG: bifunctional diaminohydroxyphosphoribosylaminopyrimidine deaminase/5-amino-6-(5-phosphoribosylamino)uracil reductase RibD [Planctomycetes bacterium]|nr:bifunctional diaminohydroxyphosphoribosylaminopyrimidine deaminase/5-amino-6-(5-phosphoribosylamino)uracil reductase RibD [Planctomycetota bacterium]
MDRALALARRGEDAAEPNPLVGAVVARGDEVVGEGCHERFGHAHAEVHALRAAGERARGATLYVTLEPCVHLGKKTPPCLPLVLASGVTRVVAAMADPYPAVKGRGFEALRAAGVEVRVGVREAEARRLNAPFVQYVTTRMPWVVAKWAMTLDGKIASRTGDSKWITSDESRRLARRWRQQCGAVVVGVETVLRDDPELRGEDPAGRQPLRVVLDSSARTPLASRLVRSAREVPVLIVHAQAAPPDRLRALEVSGCRLLALAPSSVGPRPDFREVIRVLGAEGLPRVFVEGGGRVLASAFESRVVGEARVFVAPRILGGADASTPVAGSGAPRISEAFRLEDARFESIGPDWLLRGRLCTLPPSPA